MPLTRRPHHTTPRRVARHVCRWRLGLGVGAERMMMHVFSYCCLCCCVCGTPPRRRVLLLLFCGVWLGLCGVPVLSVAFSADGSRVVSGSGDNTVRVWDVASGEVVKQLDGHSDAVRKCMMRVCVSCKICGVVGRLHGGRADGRRRAAGGCGRVG